MIYFKESEYYCPCGCGLGFEDMDEDFVLKIDRARHYAKVPFVLTSSIRCIKHNIKEGGSETSSHLIGLANDIKCLTSYYRYRIIYGLMKAGFTRFKIGIDFIHVDDDQDKPKELLWLK